MLTMTKAGELFGMDPREALFSIRGLSAREGEVASYYAAGWTCSQIAQVLGISPRTVTAFRDRIKRKLGISDNAIPRIYWAARVAAELEMDE